MSKLPLGFFVLLSGTFLSTMAQATDVDVARLNSLTGGKVTWSATDNGGTAVQIGDKTFYYKYHKPAGYEETSERLENQLDSADVDKKVFEGITGADSGGAIYQDTDVSDVNINSDFVNNSTSATSGYGGGMSITKTDANIDSIRGDFIGNQSSGTNVYGGALFLMNSNGKSVVVDTIEGNFINNSAEATSTLHSGGIDNHATIHNLNANFIGNYAHSTGGTVNGGALNNGSTGSVGSGIIDTLSGAYIGNTAKSDTGSAFGGAINNTGTIGTILNSDFLYNSVVGNSSSKGGAIYSTKDLNIKADNYASLFRGNTANGSSSAIYITGADLNLTGENNGSITFDDDIDGSNYDLNILGSNNGEVVFNQNVNHANNLTISDEGIMRIGVDANVNASNMHPASGTPESKPTVKVDIEVDKDNQTTNSGIINIEEEVSGDYNVIVNSLNSNVYDGANTIFLSAPNDTDSTNESFEVSRVIGSPYMWEALLNYGGETAGSTWYLSLTGNENPDYRKPSVVFTPEVIAAMGLHEAAIEQTRTVVSNVRGKVAAGREMWQGCSPFSCGCACNKDNAYLHNVWVLTQGQRSNIKEPVDMDAKIWSLEAGFDIQSDLHHTLGVFGSYRVGDYDLSGKARKVYSSVGSDIDIDSYLAGLYYRYDRYLAWAFATVYGGVQKAEVKTDDGIARFKTDGMELGASVEVGRNIPLSDTVNLAPSLGLSYTQIDFKKTSDNVGKYYDWDYIKYLEAELGLKLEKQFDNSKVYIKPSILQTYVSGDRVHITGLPKIKTYDDQTLGRVEVGTSYSLDDAWSIYAWANYTFGSSYEAYLLGAGLNYRW